MIEIKNLLLRLPDMDADAGREIAELVGHRIAELLPPPHQNRYIELMDLQLTLSAGLDRGQMVERIAGAIVGKVQSGYAPAGPVQKGPASRDPANSIENS
ncbi:MAG: hypothetical protein R2824_25535 [Saprospiraceae bacterium]|nr:hypothetical protein [Lewinella sp.]